MGLRWHLRKKGQGMTIHVIIRRWVPESDFAIGTDFFRLPPEATCDLPMVRGRVSTQARVRATLLIETSPMLDLLPSSILFLEGFPQRGAQEAHEEKVMRHRSQAGRVHDI
jgi:hypothetical protein